MPAIFAQNYRLIFYIHMLNLKSNKQEYIKIRESIRKNVGNKSSF